MTWSPYPWRRNALPITVITVTALAWGLWFARGRAQAFAAAAAPNFATAAPLRAVTTTSATSADPAAPGTVRVLGDGGPVANAEVWAGPRSTRQLDPTTCRLLGHTGADGRFQVPPDAIGSTQELVVRAAGYQAAALSPPTSQQGVQARLTAGSALRVRCQLADGTPVAGARVLLTRSTLAMDRYREHVGLPAGGDPRGAIYSAVSDATGCLMFEGLPPTRLQLRIEHDEFALAGDTPRDIEIPHDDLTVRFVEVLGCVLQAPADDWVETGKGMAGGGKLRTSALAFEGARAIEQRLRARHPGAFVVALPATADGATRQVRCKALLRRRGWHEFTHELAPLRALGVQPLPIAGDHAPAFAELTVTVPRADLATGELVLVHEDGGIGCQVPVQVGTKMRLPAGGYTLLCTSLLWRRKPWSQPVDLAAGEARVLELPDDGHVAVKIAATTPAGDPIGSSAIRIVHDGREVASTIILDGGLFELPLTVGTHEVHLHAIGMHPIRRTLVVPDDLSEQPLAVRFEYVD